MTIFNGFLVVEVNSYWPCNLISAGHRQSTECSNQSQLNRVLSVWKYF